MKLKSLSLLACCISFALQAEVAHMPTESVNIGERATVSGTLDNNKAIKEARLYFKSNLGNDFIFVDLDKNGRVLQATLPAPGPSMGQLDYFFAVKYQDGTFERSDVFGTKVQGEWDEESRKRYANVLEVQSELSSNNVSVQGFANNLKYGYQVAKLLSKAGNALDLSALGSYTAVLSGGGTTASAATGTAVASSGAATGGVAAGGTIGGLSMTTVGIGVGVAAVGVGAGAAATGGDDGEDIEIVNVIDETEGSIDSTVSQQPGGLNNGIDIEGDKKVTPLADVTCGTLVKGSGDIPTQTITKVEIGTNTGDVNFSYNLGSSISDQIIVTHNGNELFNSGCTRGNGNSTMLKLEEEGDTFIEVRVNANCKFEAGTYWDFTAQCVAPPPAP